MSYLIQQYLRQLPFTIERGDVTDDVFTDSLLIQKCITTLDKQGLFSDIEKDILIAIVEGYNYAEIAKILQLDRQTISTLARNVTDRIAYVLGGEFTDEGLADRLPFKHMKKTISNLKEEHNA